MDEWKNRFFESAKVENYDQLNSLQKELFQGIEKNLTSKENNFSYSKLKSDLI